MQPFLEVLKDQDLMRSNTDKVANLLCQNLLNTLIRCYSAAEPDNDLSARSVTRQVTKDVVFASVNAIMMINLLDASA